MKELYMLSESGAFDNVDEEVINSVTNSLRCLLDSKVSYNDLEKITGINKVNLVNHINRKVPTKFGFRNYRLISWSVVKKILPQKKKE
ncbi:MAG: hypothetical protein RRY36_08110 [Bacteroidaceae bacterium]